MARLKKLLPLLVIVLLALIVFALFQTGTWPFGGSDQDTTGTTTKVATSSTTVTATTAGTQEEQALQYAADLAAWRATYWGNIDAGAFTFKKVTAPTKKEIERAQAVADQQTEAAAALKLILAPKPVAAVHAKYIAVIDAEAHAVQRMMTAIKNKSWRDVELVMRDLTKAHTLEISVVGELDDYMSEFRPTVTSAGDTAGYATFSDTKLGFSVQYPAAWKTLPTNLYADKERPAEVTLAITDNSGNLGAVALNLIMVEADQRDSKTGESPQRLLDKDLADLEADATDANQLKILQANHAVKVNGLDAAEAVATFVMQGTVVKVRECRVAAGRTMIGFTVFAEEKDWDKANAIFEAVMKSLDAASTT